MSFCYVVWMSMWRKSFNKNRCLHALDLWSMIWTRCYHFHVPWISMFLKLFIQNLYFGQISKGRWSLQEQFVLSFLFNRSARRFRLIPASTYIREFASDRSHMVSSLVFISKYTIPNIFYSNEKSFETVNIFILLLTIRPFPHKVLGKLHLFDWKLWHPFFDVFRYFYESL